MRPSTPYTAAMPFARDDYLDLVDGRRADRCVFAPLADATFAAGLLERDWASDVGWDDQVEAARRCGYAARFVRGSAPDLHCNPALDPVCELVAEGAEERRWRQVLPLPEGDLTRELVERRGHGLTALDEWLTGLDDLDRADRISEGVLAGGRDAAIREEYGSWVAELVPHGVTQVQVELPWFLYGLAGFAERPVLAWMTDPERYARSMELAERALVRVVDALLGVGVDMIWVGAGGTELLSPDIYERVIVPQARRMAERVHARGGRLHFHCCGRSRLWVERGYFDRCGTDVLETLSAPPSGDVDDLGWARRRIDPGIVTQGNLDLELLRRGRPSDCAAAAEAVIAAVAGRPHLVAAGDDLLRGTPPENLVAVREVCEAADARGGRLGFAGH